MHHVSEMCSGSFIGGIVAGALALAVVSLAIFAVIRFVKRRKEMENGLFDAQARINILCERLVQKFPDINLEYDPTATQDVGKPSIRERLGRKKWYIILVLAIVALVIGAFVVTYNDDAPKEHSRSGKHAKVQATDSDKDEAPAAPASKADACGKCKPDRPGGIIDTAADGYVFADKCVGAGDSVSDSACASCKPVGCIGENAGAPPSCTACSQSGK